MNSSTKNSGNRKLGAYPSQFWVLSQKSLVELLKIKAGLPRRVGEANRISNLARRTKMVAKLQGEWVLVEKAIAAKSPPNVETQLKAAVAFLAADAIMSSTIEA